MPKDTEPTSSKEPKPAFRISKLFLFRFWLPKGDPERYEGRLSTVFNDDGLNYVRSYELLHDYYIKKVDGLSRVINLFEMGLYENLMRLEKDGEGFTVEQYAAEREYHPETISIAIDNLENVNLLHRERSRDRRGCPFVYVLHTPLAPDDLRRQRRELLKRREQGFIQQRRMKAGRNKRDWLPEAFSWKKLLAAFGANEWLAERFENIVGDVVHQHISDPHFNRRQFWDEVENACIAHKVLTEEKHQALAFEIKRYIERMN